MSQRNSEYKRHSHDLYETPEWVTRALLPYLPARPMSGSTVWEPAAATGKISRVLAEAGYAVLSTDIREGDNFLSYTSYPGPGALLGVVTNPPYNIAPQFIRQALAFPSTHFVAMLLRSDFDHAKTRADLFGSSTTFSRKVVLTKRIVWVEREDGKRASPSENHAWYIWDKFPSIEKFPLPTLVYAP